MPNTPQKTNVHLPTLLVSIKKKHTNAAARPAQDTMTLPRRAFERPAIVKKSVSHASEQSTHLLSTYMMNTSIRAWLNSQVE